MKSIRKRVLILGYYGSNMGDIAMLKALVSFLARRGVESTIYSYASVSNGLREELAPHDIRPLKHAGRLQGLLGFLLALMRSDAIVWGGGTCFMDEGGEGGIKYMLLARLLLKKVFYVGIGVGKTERRSTRTIIRLAYLISRKIIVRDVESQRKIRGSDRKKIVVAPDLIYGLQPLLATLRPRNVGASPRLLLSYRDVSEYFPSDKTGTYLRQFIARVRELCESNGICQIVIMAADNDVDVSNARQIQEELAAYVPAQYMDSHSFTKKIDAICNADIVITGRLHVAVVAYILGKPFLLLNYSPKNEYFVKDVGAENCLVQYEDLSIPHHFTLALSKATLSRSIFGGKEDVLNRTLEESFVNLL